MTKPSLTMHTPIIRTLSVRRARVEIIPLIDVIFFLLATFVLFTLSMSRIFSLPLDLPRAGDPEPGAEPPVILQVSEGTSLYWDKELIDVQELPLRLAAFKRDLAAAGKVPRVMVANDEKAKFGAAVRVLDELRLAGIEQFSVETSNERRTGR